MLLADPSDLRVWVAASAPHNEFSSPLALVSGASIAHKLLARGLKTCLNFKNDSMVSALDYIASVNSSASQLSHVQPMTVQDVYALVTLMGLYLSEASGHQKAYKELLAYIDDGHALTLDKVQHEIIRIFPSEGSLSGGLLFRFCISLRLCLEGKINLSSLPDGLAILFEILIPFPIAA
jgi:hypothetical protein